MFDIILIFIAVTRKKVKKEEKLKYTSLKEACKELEYKYINYIESNFENKELNNKKMVKILN